MTDVIPLLKKDLKNGKDVRRLLSIIRVCISLLEFVSENRDHKQSILECLIQLFDHQYPRVRHYLAEQFYMLLLSSSLFDDETQTKLSEFIVEVDW